MILLEDSWNTNRSFIIFNNATVGRASDGHLVVELADYYSVLDVYTPRILNIIVDSANHIVHDFEWRKYVQEPIEAVAVPRWQDYG